MFRRLYFNRLLESIKNIVLRIGLHKPFENWNGQKEMYKYDKKYYIIFSKRIHIRISLLYFFSAMPISNITCDLIC